MTDIGLDINGEGDLLPLSRLIYTEDIMDRDTLIYRMNKGDTMPGLILVENNVFDIPKRLREIDPGYFVMFNPENQKYELHNENQDTTYCLTFPFDELDSRAIDYTRETRIERKDIILKQIKQHNEKVERDRRNEFEDKVDYIAREIHRSALRRNEIPDPGAFTTRWV